MSSKERLLIPGVLLSELFKHHLPEGNHNRDRLIVDAVEQAVHEQFFAGISILPISDEKQKDRLGHIAKENDLRITVWFNPILAGEYNKRVILEPLDRGAHKNGLIGPVREAAAIAAELETEHKNFSLCWDTAHAVLCGDTLYSSLYEILPWMSQIHLSNAVIDPRDPLFGDFHMEIGRPGFLDISKIKEIIRMMNEGISTDVRKGYADTIVFAEPRIVTVEVRTPKDYDPWVMMDRCHDILKVGGLG